jgi:hypothetical protein
MPHDPDSDRATHPAPARGQVGLGALWFGLAGGFAAWSVQTLVNLALASHACYPRLYPLAAPVVAGMRGIVFAVGLAALAVCVAAMATAWRSWARTRHEQQPATGSGQNLTPETALLETGEGRTRFLAFAGVLTSVTFLLVSVVHTTTLFLVAPCGQR